MSRGLPPHWIALSPGDLTPDSSRDFLKRLVPLCRSGLPALLLREPQLDARFYLELASAARRVLKKHNAALILHDAPHLVSAADAQGVHLGFRSLSPVQVRAMVPDSIWIGRSTHAGDDIGPEGIDYVSYGPVFATPSKVGLVEPIGLPALQERVEAGSQHPLGDIPVWALGGISPQNVRKVWATGVHGVALRGGFWNDRRPARIMRLLLKTKPKGPGSSGVHSNRLGLPSRFRTMPGRKNSKPDRDD